MALTDADRQWLLENLAKRIDLGFARDQIMTHLGNLATAPPLPASALPEAEVARRVDVEELRDLFESGHTEIVALLHAIADHLGIEVPETPDEEDPEDPDEENPEEPEDPDDEEPEPPTGDLLPPANFRAVYDSATRTVSCEFDSSVDWVEIHERWKDPANTLKATLAPGVTVRVSSALAGGSYEWAARAKRGDEVSDFTPWIVTEVPAKDGDSGEEEPDEDEDDEETPDEEEPPVEDPNPSGAWRPDPSRWKVTLPVAGSNGKPRELIPFALFPPFVVGREDGVLFNAPCVAVSTENSSYPRSELREMNGSGGLAAWSNASGSHEMEIYQRITKTPVKKPHVVAAQIHDEDDDVIMVRLEGKNLFIESDGDEIASLEPNYVLGTPYRVKIVAADNRIKVFFNGVQKLDLARAVRGGYFKAGAYTQSNPSKGDAPTAAGEVIIHDLVLTHR